MSSSEEMTIRSRGPTGPALEIESRVRAARAVTALDSTLETVFHKHRDLLVSVLGRQIDLISLRSPKLEDAQVTVFDKVLVELVREDQESPASITWFCKEYLGYNPAVDPADNILSIQQGLALPVTIMQGWSISVSHMPGWSRDTDEQGARRSNETSEPARRRHHNHQTPAEHRTFWDAEDPSHRDRNDYSSSRPTSPMEPREIVKGTTTTTATTTIDTDPKIARLWAVYEKALADYLAIADQETYTTREAAKWLRDTAENGIHYLQAQSNPDSHRHLISQLRNTHTMASRMAEKLTGGRKRKFDHQVEMQEFRYRPAKRRVAVEVEDEDDTGRTRAGGSRLRTENDDRELYPDKMTGYRGGGRDRYDMIRRTNYFGRGVPRGRGHSGIPYGYASTRFVDTYIPDRRRD